MNKDILNMLSIELKGAGASDAEIRGLLNLASDLGRLTPDNHSKQRLTLRSTGPPFRLPLLVLGGMACLLIGMSLTTFAQTSLPGSWLYPAKRLSEQAAVLIQPAYRAAIMMRRAQEVRSLVADHAGSRTVLATLSAYQTAASAYKFDVTNYSAFEYCKTNLEQAETRATSQEQQAIKTTLASLQDV